MINIYSKRQCAFSHIGSGIFLFLFVFIFAFMSVGKLDCMRLLADTKYNAKYPRLVDKADVLTDEEEKKLLKKLNKISKEEEVDVVVLTVENEADDDITAFADDYYDYNYYGFGDEGDGIILVVTMVQETGLYLQRGRG